MLAECALACHPACNDMGVARCSNLDYRCNDWASDGECDVNADWMRANCPRSCDTSCQGQSAAAVVSSSGDCVNMDNDVHCDFLAATRGCAGNVTLLTRCRKSCSACVTTGELTCYYAVPITPCSKHFASVLIIAMSRKRCTEQ